jgi:hypothetical protein
VLGDEKGLVRKLREADRLQIARGQVTTSVHAAFAGRSSVRALSLTGAADDGRAEGALHQRPPPDVAPLVHPLPPGRAADARRAREYHEPLVSFLADVVRSV